MIHFFLIFLLSHEGFAQFTTLPIEKRYNVSTKKTNTVKKSSLSPQKSSSTTKELETLTKIKESNARIENLLSQNQNRKPLIIDSSFRFLTGDVLRGHLLNSVVSTNLESPLLIEVNDEKLPKGTKISCNGVTKHKRVITACSLLITPTKEYSIEALALNPDGSAGLKGTYYDGKEEYISSMLALEFARGVIEISQEKSVTNLGAVYNQPTVRNKMLQGLTNSAGKSSDLIEDEMRSKEPKVYINAGKEVLIYFVVNFQKKIFYSTKTSFIFSKMTN